MRRTVDLLARYAEYHRDRRNILTHAVGVPMMVFALGVLMSRPVMPLGQWLLTPAWVLYALAAAWYLTRGHWQVGLAVSAGIGLLLAMAHSVGNSGTASWLSWGVGTFLLGWLFQSLGHLYEGRKPPFVQDLVGLLVAPMFVAAEGLFAMGWCLGLQREIERRAGPTMLRDLATPVPQKIKVRSTWRS